MATKLNLLPTAPGLKKAVVKEVQTTGTEGGTFTSGSFITRTINTLEGDADIVSISSNQITIQPGHYLVFGTAPAFMVNNHKCLLYNITDSSNETIGSSCFSSPSFNEAVTCSHFATKLVLTEAKTYELRHRCTTTRATDGLGPASGFSEDEVYSEIKIIQLSEV